MVKVVIITDIHSGPDMGTKKGTAALPLLDEFVEFANTHQPDLLIDLGDRVNHVDHDADIKSMKAVMEKLSSVNAPRIHVIGNHDVDFISLEENQEIVEDVVSSHIKVREGVSFVCWNARSNLDIEDGFKMDDRDLEWLENAVEEIKYPAVLCTHTPIDNGSLTGNFYFDVMPHLAHYPAEQAAKAREIIERSGKFILCLNGHAHWTQYHCIDGIHYVTLPSLIETFPTYPDPNAAWSWMEINGETIELEIFGNTPYKFELPVRKENHHWASNIKDYAPSADDKASK